ncbi:hypothetical protein BDW72DRAFT_33745 [Aspergillus terricola var. indicus]
MARGYGSSRYGGLPSCSEYAFEMDAPRIDVAFAALYFIVTLVLWILASLRISRSKKRGQHVAGAVFLMLSIVFAWSAHIVMIIYTTLTQCDIYDYSHVYQAAVLIAWLSSFSRYLLLAAILISITRKLQTDFGLVQPAILNAQKVLAVLIGLLVTTALCIHTAWNHYYYKDFYSFDSFENLFQAQRGVWTAYYSIAAAGMLLASATLGKTLSQAPGGLRSRGTTVSIILLVIGALGMTLTHLGNYVQNAYIYNGRSFYSGSSEYKEYVAKTEAANFLASFFYCLAFYAAVRVGSQHANAPAMTSAYAPPAPPPQPPMTFTTGNEGYNSAPPYYQSMGQEQGYGRNPEYVR